MSRPGHTHELWMIPLARYGTASHLDIRRWAPVLWELAAGVWRGAAMSYVSILSGENSYSGHVRAMGHTVANTASVRALRSVHNFAR